MGQKLALYARVLFVHSIAYYLLCSAYYAQVEAATTTSDGKYRVLNITESDLIKLYAREGPATYTWFKHTLKQRNLPMNITTYNEISKLLKSTRRRIPPDGSRNAPFSFDIKGAMQSCCECADYKFNCPVCLISGTIICERPYHDFSPKARQWYSSTFSPGYNLVRNLPTSDVPVMYGPAIGFGGPGYVTIGRLARCEYSSESLQVYVGTSESATCTHVFGPTGTCPVASVNRSFHGCDWIHGINAELDFNYKMCYAPLLTTIHLSRAKDGVVQGFCNNMRFGKYFAHFPALSEFLQERTEYDSSLRPTPLGIIDNEYLFEIEDDSRMLNLISMLSNSELLTPVSGSTTPQKVDCGGRFPSSIFDGRPSVIGDVFLHPPCSGWLPYDKTRFICRDALNDRYPYCPDQIFGPRSLNKITYGVNVDEIQLHPLYNISCGRIERLGFCFLGELMNSTFSNVTDRIDQMMNKTFDNFANNFLDIMGRNETPNGYRYTVRHTNGTVESRIVGNWFTSIFGALIAPFFHAFIEIVLSTILNPIIEAVVYLIKDLADLLSRLSDEVKLVVDALAEALSQLCLIVYNVTAGLILQIESRVLLLEYTVLFLILIYYFNRGWVFSIVVVVIAMLIFPIERHHPSLIISVINPDYIGQLNLTSLLSKTYDYEYSIGWSNGDSLRTVYYFHNLSLVQFHH